MSKVAGFIVGAIEIGIGIAIGNPALIIQGSLTILAQGAVDLLAKSSAKQAAETTIQLGEQPRTALFGEAATAGTLVDAFDFGGKYGTDWECLVIRLEDHKCAGLTGFFVNDTYVAYTGDGNYAEFNSPHNEHLHLYFRADTSSDPVPAEVSAVWPGYAATDIGKSGCDVFVLYRADKPNAKKLIWPGGRPRFLFVVKGKLCYDPRLDDTVGGSGAHRWNDPSTWEWSENPAVCRYNWVRGIYAEDQVGDPTQLLVGRGLSAAEAPPANIFAAANLCDEVVGGGVRYRIAGSVSAGQPFIDVEAMFAAATAGNIITHEGSVELEPGAAKSVVASFTDDDLLSGSSVTWNEAVLSDADDGWVNTVVGNYVEPSQQWQAHDAPVARNTDDILADGGPRENTLTLTLVKDVGQAQRVAEISRRLGRLWGRAQVTLGPRFCEIEEGDWIEWQSDRRFGGATRTFRVDAYSIDEKWHNTLTLREIAADVYGDDAVFNPDYSVATPTAPPPDVGTPDAGGWVLAAVVLTDGGVSTPALELTGSAADDGSAEQIVVEYWKSDGVIDPVANPDSPNWIMEGSHSPTTTKVDITSIEGGQTYYVAVSYVVSGELGDRLVLGPVTPAAIDVSASVTPIVDAAVGKLSWKEPVRLKTAAALAANTYANGASGVGATLTATANGALAAIDGVAPAAGDRVLVDQEATGAHNGIYVVTQLGDATHPYILTRTDDADEPAELVNAAAKVSEGTAYADQEWQCTTNAAIVLGTTGLVWAAAGGSGALSVQDEGVAQGSAGTINFTGAGVTSSVSGGVATVNVPGGGGGAAHTAATLRGVSTAQSGSSATLTINLPTGTVAGDYLMAFLSGGNALSAVPAGWTVVLGEGGARSGTGSNGIVLIKEAALTSADITAGSVTFTFAAAYYQVGALVSFNNPTGIIAEVLTQRLFPGGYYNHIFQNDWQKGPMRDDYLLVSYLHQRASAANSISGGTSATASNANTSMCINYRTVSFGDVVTQALNVGATSSWETLWWQVGVMAA